MIKLRKMSLGDMQAVSDLCWQEEAMPKENLPRGVKEASGYVLELDGECVGFISVTTLNDRPYIDYLLVASNHRRKGFGEILVEEVKNRREYLFLHVKQANGKAIRLYKRCEFKQVACGVGKHKDKICMDWSRPKF